MDALNVNLYIQYLPVHSKPVPMITLVPLVHTQAVIMITFIHDYTFSLFNPIIKANVNSTF